ncbi:uncharacterized protein LOC128955366 [Oppia nitens]|uniref:uncharacterized protein LOC128955366 n=1 Tax=Oppia nitens TaxID=1686743 RepID=UPI0023DA8625|nr:uncharacterized protein LOC128955366 [Oppia nitens]
MTFNTPLFRRLFTILAVLVIVYSVVADCKTVTTTAKHTKIDKNNGILRFVKNVRQHHLQHQLQQQQQHQQNEGPVSGVLTTKISANNNNNKNREKVATIDYNSMTTAADEDDEEDRTLQAANDVYHDYEMNGEQGNATEAPDMDPNAELVDEKGEKDIDTSKDSKGDGKDDDDVDDDDEDDVTLKSAWIMNNPNMTTAHPLLVQEVTTKRPQKPGDPRINNNTVVMSNTSTTMTTPKPRKLTDKVKSLLQNTYTGIKTKINSTIMTTRQLCLETAQDSGYWCSNSTDHQTGRLTIRYYYHKDRKVCECFLYYGCFGNKNNFNTVKECENSCGWYFGIDDKRQRQLSKDDCSINP